MHAIHLNIDDSIFDEFMKSLDSLPKDKLVIVSDKVFSNKHDINQLLEEGNLLHFTYYQEDNKIVYSLESGTPVQKADFTKLVKILKSKNIKYDNIGLDVLMIEH